MRDRTGQWPILRAGLRTGTSRARQSPVWHRSRNLHGLRIFPGAGGGPGSSRDDGPVPILLLEEVAKPNVRGYPYGMTSTELHELETLGVSERVQLVQDLWDSIARSNAELPVPQWQQDELSRRKQRFLQHPEEARSWDEVRRDILQGK